MLLYPIAYTILILPIACCRFSEWTGHKVPVAATIFSDFIYLLSGLVHVVLFASTRRILPPRSIIPKFLISGPRALLSSTDVPDGDFDSYYDDAAWHSHTAEKKNGAIIFERHLFVGPVLPPMDEAMIKRVRNPDSERSLSRASPRTLSPTAGDHADLRAVSPSLGTQRGPSETETEADLEDNPDAQIFLVPTHREGEKMELPQTPLSARV